MTKRKHKSMRQKARERAQSRESAGGVHYLNMPEDHEFFKVVKGRNNFSILPYEISVDNHPYVEKGELWYQRTMWVHYNVGIEEKTEICLLKTFKEKCPICERRMELMRSEDSNDEEADELKPKQRELFNVLNEDDEIQLLYISHFNFGKLLEEEILEDEDCGGFADIEDGHSLSVRFKMETFAGNKFLKASKIDFKSRKDLKESILDDVLDLDAVMVPKSYDDLYNAFWDVEKEDRTEKRGHDEKSEKKSSRSRKKRSEKKEPEKKEPEKEKAPAKKAPAKKAKPKAKPKEKKLECPEDGITFGKDYDEYECCDDCDIRKECEGSSEEHGEVPEKSDPPDGDCPHGHTFAEDCNKEDECDECDEWEACQDAHDTL